MAERRFSNDPVTVRLRVDDMAELRAEKDRTGRPLAEFVRDAVSEYLDNRGRDNKNEKAASMAG
jgi:hypothetical protein